MRTNDEIISLIENLSSEKNISLSELARMVNMSKSSVSMYFSKKRKFPLDRANIFAKALNVTPEYLIGVTPISKNNKETIDLKETPAKRVAFDGREFDEDDLDFMNSVMESYFKNKYKD